MHSRYSSHKHAITIIGVLLLFLLALPLTILVLQKQQTAFEHASGTNITVTNPNLPIPQNFRIASEEDDSVLLNWDGNTGGQWTPTRKY